MKLVRIPVARPRHVRSPCMQHEIRQLARLLFDVPGAARRVLEPECSALSVVEREEFIRLFGDRLL